jgi:hypothetical protein
MLENLLNRFRIRQFIAGIAGLLLGLLLNIASDWLSGAGNFMIPIVAVGFVVALVVNGYLWLRRPARVGLQLEPPDILDEAAKPEKARRGLIVFVSLYSPQSKSSASSLKLEERVEAAKSKNYKELDFENSNLATTVKAIIAHASTLEHCWLIATISRANESSSSLLYVPALIELLKEKYGMHCKFHFGEEFAVTIDDDAPIFIKTIDIVNRIFKLGKEEGLREKDFVVDFTAGMRSMTLGAILACLDHDRNIQMIGTKYDAEGRPQGPLFPIIFSFKPILRE